MKNIHILPINLDNVFQKSNRYIINQNVYIISNEEIKEGGWLLIIDDFETYVHKHKGDNLPTTYHKKIILTTDQDLIADGVQAIDDEFLEWFVKNPSCEFIEYVGDDCYYEIIIPQEEPKQDSVFENAKLVLREHLLENKEQVTKDLQEMKVKSSTNRDETLEDAAEMYSNSHQDVSGELGKYLVKAVFQDGANWQAERMYSEKEVFEIVATILHTPTLRDGSWEDISKWFEKNKKK
jgi:hypothetical protein